MQRFLDFLTEQTDEERIDPVTFSIQGLYTQLNGQCFGGELPVVPTSFGKTPKGVQGVTTGQIIAPRGLPMWARKTKKETVKVAIKPYTYRLGVLKGILAHEMCHVWNMVNDQHEQDSHGMYFQNIMRKAQSKAEFKIPMRHEADEEEKEMSKKPCVFLAMGKPSKVHAVLYNQTVTTKSDTLANATALMPRILRSYDWVIFGFGTSHLAASLPLAREVKPMISKLYDIKDISNIKILKIYRHEGMLPTSLFS